MFKVLVHGCQEARFKPLIHVIQTSNRSLIFTEELAFFRNEGGFPFRKPLGVIFVALRNFFEALDHTLVQGASTFPPKVSDFIRPWRTPVALLGQDFDRFRYFESPFVACRWRYLLVDRELYSLQPGRVLIPSRSLFPQLSPKPAPLFNIASATKPPKPVRLFIIIIIIIIIRNNEKNLLTTMLTIKILFTINSLKKKKKTIH